MEQYSPYLTWIKEQHSSMISLLTQWANINSGSENIAGLSEMLHSLNSAFSKLGGEIRETNLPPCNKIDEKGQPFKKQTGKALQISKHRSAPIQVLLAGHMDTVYDVTDAFQKVEEIEANILRGPGVADMKGGLVVLLYALLALERSPFSGKIGWEVLINPDEEIGSPSSEPLYIAAAKRNHLGLLFEPSFPDGCLVSARKGSANFTLVARGRAAHAGRDFHSGRNAIFALTRIVNVLESLSNPSQGITVNVGYIQGGGPVNIVPDLAMCKFNLRVTEMEDMTRLTTEIDQLVKESNADGITMTLYETASRAPKPFDDKNKKLYHAIKECAEDLKMPLECKPSGGVCDGNILSEHGLPTIDTLGVIGGNIHTPEEYVLLNSLTDRAALVAYFLMSLGHKQNGSFIKRAL